MVGQTAETRAVSMVYCWAAQWAGVKAGRRAETRAALTVFRSAEQTVFLRAAKMAQRSVGWLVEHWATSSAGRSVGTKAVPLGSKKGDLWAALWADWRVARRAECWGGSKAVHWVVPKVSPRGYY